MPVCGRYNNNSRNYTYGQERNKWLGEWIDEAEQKKKKEGGTVSRINGGLLVMVPVLVPPGGISAEVLPGPHHNSRVGPCDIGPQTSGELMVGLREAG